MEINNVIIFGIIFFIVFTGVGWAILNLIYTWLKIKLNEIKEGVFLK